MEEKRKKKIANSLTPRQVCGRRGALHVLVDVLARLRLWSSVARLKVH
jgi:hypothetical protein